jgi:putative FmdB family regulatory protein
MPIFEYACHDCGKQFETLVRSETVPACPACGSVQLEKQLSVFATTTVTESAGAAMPSPCGSCGNPGGPGACAFNR